MLHTGYGVSITPDGGSATLINGITQQNVRVGGEHTAEPVAGNSYAAHGAINRIRPGATFTTYDLANALDLLGLRGACMAGGSSAGAEFYQLQLEACGTVKTGSNHRKIIMPNGLVVPRTLNVSHQQDATLDCEALAYYDGTNKPLIPTESIAAPTGLAGCPRWTLGAITIESVTISGNLSVAIDFGNGAITDGGDSEPYDTHIQIPTVVPTIRIRTREVGKFKTSSGIPLDGLHGTHANTEILLRKRAIGTAGFTTDADWIRFTADCVVSWDDGFNASGNSRGEAGLMLTCIDDGTNAPLVIETDYDDTPA